jgi:hypothetical protein
VGPLGLGSPRVRAEVAPCPTVLCVATTASVRPGRYALGSLPIPWVDALLFVFRSACAVFGSHDGRVGLHTPGCCSSRSPCFRLCLPKRREALPSSRITLLPTCPALRPRWCPARLPWREQDCCLPVHANRRLSARFPGPILLSTTIQFSEFNLAACVLASPLLRTPHFCDRTSVRLPTRWLTVGRVGLDGFRYLTHWVTLMSFKGNHPYSLVPDLPRHEHGVVSRTQLAARPKYRSYSQKEKISANVSPRTVTMNRLKPVTKSGKTGASSPFENLIGLPFKTRIPS